MSTTETTGGDVSVVLVAAWLLSGVESATALSLEGGSQRSMAARIDSGKGIAVEGGGCVDVTGKSSKTSCNWGHCCRKETPEWAELWALCYVILVMEFLAGTASQRQVHPDRLRGLLTLVKEFPAAVPFKAISPETLVERATSALTKPVNPL